MHPEDTITLAHGGGGELTARLVGELIIRKLGNETLSPLDDGAVFNAEPGSRICFTTDSYVVDPIEFPGGDIGTLAVCGTVNDLAVMGARPHALSLGLIIEEGLAVKTLERIVDSIAASAEEAGVRIVTGDTKVIERSRGESLFINTAGIGFIANGVNISLGAVEPGDAVLVTGRIAEHGLAVMSKRKGLSFSTEILSDAAPLNELIAALTANGAQVKFMRDPTRGGLAGVLADIAGVPGIGVEINEDAVPLSVQARHACEMLGLDPLAVANEGKVVVVVAARDADETLSRCRSHPLGRDAAIIGRVTDQAGRAVLITRIGGRRIIQRPYGEDLPRIC